MTVGMTAPMRRRASGERGARRNPGGSDRADRSTARSLFLAYGFERM